MGLGESAVKVTVIIPVHNSEKYLEECIMSAQLQELKEIEILCIDGGSSDSSPDIITRIQKEDKRIIYISDSNTSYGHKLNEGIDKARGKYISILESDDKMKPNMIKDLYEIAVSYNVDIVDADYSECFSCNGREYEKPTNKYTSDTIYGVLLEDTEVADREIPESGIWTALYKKDFLIRESIRLNESRGASFQDTSFLFLTGLLAKSVYHLHRYLYQYRVNNEESSCKDNKKVFEIIDECEFLKQDLQRRNIHDPNIWIRYYIRKYGAFYWNYCRLSSKSKGIFLERYIKELEQDLQNGLIDRDMFVGSSYNYTFLAVDDKDRFAKIAAKHTKHTWVERFGALLDRIGNQKVVVFGAGICGTYLVNTLQQNENRVWGICDNCSTLQGLYNNGFIVMSVEQAVEKFDNVLYVISSRKYADEMKQQLLDEGVTEKDITIFA